MSIWRGCALSEVLPMSFRGFCQHRYARLRARYDMLTKPERIYGELSVGVVHLTLVDERHVVEAAHELGDGEHVLLTIGLDALKVVLLPIHASHLATVDVVLRRGDVEDGAEQVQRGEVLVVAELPQLHGVDEVGLPRLLACHLQYARDGYAVNHHAAGDVGEVELLAVVGAELRVRRVVVLVQHVGEVGKQGLLVVAVKRLQTETLTVEEAHRDADDFAKFGVYACAGVGRPSCPIVFASVR